MKKLLTIIVLAALLTGCASMLWFPIASISEPVDAVEESEETMMEKIMDTPIDAPITEHIPDPPQIPEPQYIPVPTRPMVALTFDDGPGRHTNSILDVLEEHGGQATFFVLGYRVERYPDTVIRAANLNNEIANHSWSHPRLPELNTTALTEEIERTSAIITATVGHSPSIMRPPFGRTSPHVRSVAEGMGYSLINWTLDTLDWRYRDADRIYNVIMSEVQDGSVILMHDIHGTTAAAMERVIPSLIYRGYDLVTVSYLLEHFYGELEPGKIYGRVYED